MNRRIFRQLGIVLTAGLLVLTGLAFAFAPAPPAAAASSQQEALDCGDGKTDDYLFRPAEFPDRPDQVDPKQLSVTVGRVTFWFDSLTHHERDDSPDSWDFVFKPRDATDNLSFIFRDDPVNGGGFGYVVDGPPGEGLEPTNKVCNLIDFHKGALGNFLDDRTNAEGVRWAKDGGISVDTKTSGLLDRAANDPFSQAVQKLAEVIASLIGSVSSAIEWALDAGTLMDNEGLVKTWTVVRDLVNVLFIVVLSALAVLTILRMEPQKYNVRQLLPLLVFSVIAVNFSFLFAGIIANTAAVLSQPFLSQATEFIQQAAGVGAGYSDGLVDGFGEAVVLLVASVIILVALVVLLFFLVARIIVLWVLAVLSPVVFLFLVLPLTRGEARNLVKNYIQWVYLAPIAMLLLFSGSLMLQSSLTNADTGDSGGSAILQAIFFAGITIAAVMVPLGMGGRIAQVLSKQGSRAGKGGAKGGLGVAGMIPLGKGMTVGEAMRTGRGYMKLRKDAQEQRGLERAAGLQSGIHDVLGDSSLAMAATGRDLTQAQSVTEGLVDDQLKKNRAIGLQRPDAQAVVGYSIANETQKRAMRESGEMTPERLALAESRIGRLAAAKQLAQEGFWDYDTLRHFGHTGYQGLMEGEPMIKHAKRQRYGAGHQFTRDDFNLTDFSIEMDGMDGDGMRKLYPNFWNYADPNSADSQANPAGHLIMRDLLSDQGLDGRTINTTSIRQNVDTNHRNVASPTKRRLEMATYSLGGNQVKMGLIAGNLAAKEWTDMSNVGGPDTREHGEAELARLRGRLGLEGKRGTD